VLLMPGPVSVVLRVDSDHADVRLWLAEQLGTAAGNILVVFASDAVPQTAWPELSDARVRVAFAPARRLRPDSSRHVSQIHAPERSEERAQKRTIPLIGVLHA
jgi:hypothetical protein